MLKISDKIVFHLTTRGAIAPSSPPLAPPCVKSSNTPLETDPDCIIKKFINVLLHLKTKEKVVIIAIDSALIVENKQKQIWARGQISPIGNRATPFLEITPFSIRKQLTARKWPYCCFM